MFVLPWALCQDLYSNDLVMNRMQVYNSGLCRVVQVFSVLPIPQASFN